MNKIIYKDLEIEKKEEYFILTFENQIEEDNQAINVTVNGRTIIKPSPCGKNSIKISNIIDEKENEIELVIFSHESQYVGKLVFTPSSNSPIQVNKNKIPIGKVKVLTENISLKNEYYIQSTKPGLIDINSYQISLKNIFSFYSNYDFSDWNCLLYVDTKLCDIPYFNKNGFIQIPAKLILKDNNYTLNFKEFFTVNSLKNNMTIDNVHGSKEIIYLRKSLKKGKYSMKLVVENAGDFKANLEYAIQLNFLLSFELPSNIFKISL